MKIDSLNNRLRASDYYEQREQLQTEKDYVKNDFANFLEQNASKLSPDYYNSLIAGLK